MSDGNGTTALYQTIYATVSENTATVFDEIFDILIAQPGINLNSKTEENCKRNHFCRRAGDSPLHEAVIKEKFDWVEKLVQHGAYVHVTNEFNYNRRPIHEAGFSESTNMVELLCDIIGYH